jgi:FdhE protein
VSASDLVALGPVRGERPWLRLPGDAAALFARRATRLRTLARDHAAAEWLATLATLCDAQARAVAAAPSTWQAALAAIVDVMRDTGLPAPAKAALVGLADGSPAALDARARAILDGGERPGDAGAVFVAAALQVWYGARTARLAVADVARPSHAGCPVCGFAAVAGVVDGDDKLRYLCCGLCAAEWNVTRLQCTSCGTTAGLSYYKLDGAGDAGAGVKAEACGACHAYLKLFYREQLPEAEPLADDAATLALDLLLGEAEWARAGVNLLVHP